MECVYLLLMIVIIQETSELSPDILKYDEWIKDAETTVKKIKANEKRREEYQINKDTYIHDKRETNTDVSNTIPSTCQVDSTNGENATSQEITTNLSESITITGQELTTNASEQMVPSSSTKKTRKQKSQNNVTKSSTKRKKKSQDNATTVQKTRRTASTTTKLPIVVPIRDVRVHKDDTLEQFQNICAAVSNESSYLQKTNILKKFFKHGTDGDSFKGDLKLWGRLLLPKTEKIVYSLQNKRLVRVFSQVFKADLNEMLTDLEAGNIALTITKFFENSTAIKPCNESTLSLQDTEECLRTLSTLTKDEDQLTFLTEICKKCTSEDLHIFVRLIKHDLRINAGPKHILDALHSNAYEAFKINNDINAVIDQIHQENNTDTPSLSINVKLLTPVSPMLAEACESLDKTIEKYAEHGLYAEIKYDGERVQLHKQGSDFKYLSRSLKPVQPYKVSHFGDYIKEAFPQGEDMILDCEVLMMDTKTGNPLPFGTLGKYKKNEFKDANPCLIVFDCLYFNGESLLNRPLQERSDVLQKNMKEIPNHIQISKKELIKDLNDLELMLTDVVDQGLEGLVLKNPMGLYEPGKRRWIKVKRDYLFEGKAADSVDLVVLGAWYGTGRRGGIMSVFLMGCYDSDNECWRSVTKVHGPDDEKLQALQTQLNMVKISRDANKIPSWLNITRSMAPDFVAQDPKVMPVWEIVGPEFTKSDKHTASGISIRFPRMVRVRDDKNWESATTLTELENIARVSKTNAGSRLKNFFSTQSDINATRSTTAGEDVNNETNYLSTPSTSPSSTIKLDLTEPA